MTLRASYDKSFQNIRLQEGVTLRDGTDLWLYPVYDPETCTAMLGGELKNGKKTIELDFDLDPPDSAIPAKWAEIAICLEETKGAEPEIALDSVISSVIARSATVEIAQELSKMPTPAIILTFVIEGHTSQAVLPHNLAADYFEFTNQAQRICPEHQNA